MNDSANFTTNVWLLVCDHYDTEVADLISALERLFDNTSLCGNESVANTREHIHDAMQLIDSTNNDESYVVGLLELSEFCKEANDGDYHRLPNKLNKNDFIESVENVIDLISNTEDDRINTTSLTNQVADEIAEQYDDDMYDRITLVLNHANQCANTISDIEKQLESVVNQRTTR